MKDEKKIIEIAGCEHFIAIIIKKIPELDGPSSSKVDEPLTIKKSDCYLK